MSSHADNGQALDNARVRTDRLAIELAALRCVVTALAALKNDEVARVLKYVNDQFGDSDNE
jgi:hypothetical protein